MEAVRIVSELSEAVAALGPGAEVWVTSARPLPGHLGHAAARKRLLDPGGPVLLVLGTGWGLADEVTSTADVTLSPIESPRPDGYNHLSVRAAAAIFLDRLLAGVADE